MLKHITLFIFTLLPVASGAASNNDLYLVVGSCRQQQHISDFMKVFHGEGKDFTHTCTFERKAITLDKAANRGPTRFRHIMADACTFKPNKGQHIGRVFMELLPSAVPEGLSTKPVMAPAIKNLSHYMKKNAIFEAEHIPQIQPMTGILEAPEDLNITGYPFTATIYKSTLINMLQFILILEHDKVEIDEDITDIIERTRNTLKIKLSKELSLEEEIKIRRTNHRYREAILETISILQPHLKSYNLTDALITDLKLFQSNQTFNQKFTVLDDFMAHLGMILQKDDMIKFMVDTGFKDVTIEMVDENPYNGRKNCWWIRGVKA